MAYAPDHAGIVALLGYYYFKTGDNEKAALYLKDAMRLCPDSGLLQFMYSTFCLQEGCAAKGLELINELLQYNETPPALYYIPLFFVHIGAGRLSEAAYLATKIAPVDGLSDLIEMLISLEVGNVTFDAGSLVEEECVVENRIFPAWVEGDLLNKYPDVKRRVKGLLAMHQSLCL
jgi:tetratricopeptide (TPR) repeat protein